MIRSVKLFVLELLALFGLIVGIAVPAHADSVVSIKIWDETSGFVLVTARPAGLTNGHQYYIEAVEATSGHEVDLDLGTLSSWQVAGSGCSFGGNGSGSYSVSGSKVSCVAGTGGTALSAHWEVLAISTLPVATMVARSRTPSGSDSAQYSIS